MKIAAIVLATIVLTSSIAASSAFASVECCYWESSVPTYFQVSSSIFPYGYMTHSYGTISDATFDSQSAKKWSLNSKSYVINMVDSQPSNGHTQSELRTQIVNAISSWYSTLSSSSAVIQFTDGGSTTSKPSLFGIACGTGSTIANGISEIGFCDLTDATAEVRTDFIDVSGTVKTITEADTVFSSAFSYDPTGTDSIYNIMLHEAGHWHSLGDLYLQLFSFECPGEGSATPEMCDANSGSLQWGDRDGVRWLYPKVNSFSLGASGTITGSDSAASPCCLNSGNYTPDMIFVWGDYSSGTDQTTIKAKGIWDLSSTTGSGTIGTTVTLATVSGQVMDIGATIYDVDENTLDDLIVSWSKPSGSSSIVEYEVFWSVHEASPGTALTYSGTTSVQSVPSSNGDKGTDILVYDIDGDGLRDLVVVDSFDSSGLKIYIYYGAISSSGTVSSWATSGGSGTYSINTNDDLGVALYRANRIFTIDFRDDSGRMKQHYFHISTAGDIDYTYRNNYAPLKSPGTPTGIGAGDMIQIGEQAYKENIFSWTDTTKGYYTLEWDTRLNSHL